MPEIIHDTSAMIAYLNNLENQIHHIQNLLTAPVNTQTQASLSTHPYITKTDDILGGEPVIVGTRRPYALSSNTGSSAMLRKTLPANYPIYDCRIFSRR